jgi:OmpA-OmpF porin, OOP family
MKKITALLFSLIAFCFITVFAQQKKSIATKPTLPAIKDSLIVPVSKAELGAFPYFTTLRNFYVKDSVTFGMNRTYFFDGKKFLTVDGKVSSQNLTVQNSKEKFASEFECIREFDKIVGALGGIKIYTGKLPEDKLKSLSGYDIVESASKSQIAPSALYGVVEYVIKTPLKEVWVQLVPYSLGSEFYTLLVVEKQTPLIVLNTNKYNQVSADLELHKKSLLYLSFKPDSTELLTESKDEILSILGTFQKHPDWQLTLECHNAPVGTPDYILALTEKRANAIKQQLTSLGVQSASVDAKGMGDQKPLVSNNTEQGRLTNTRIEIILQ